MHSLEEGGDNVGEVIDVTEILSTWLTKLKRSYEGDTWATQVFTDVANLVPIAKKITVHEGVIRYKGIIYVRSNNA
jgi:hypothetical protein